MFKLAKNAVSERMEGLLSGVQEIEECAEFFTCQDVEEIETLIFDGHMHEYVDGLSEVIYTASAEKIIFDYGIGAAMQEYAAMFGAEGIIKDNNIISSMAYMIIEQELSEEWHDIKHDWEEIEEEEEANN